jgi:hypothetical protein
LPGDLRELAIDPGGWAPYLDEGEVLLWEGSPSPRVHLTFDLRMIITSVFGLIFTGVSIAMLWMHIEEGRLPGVLFSIPFLAAGLFFFGGRHLWDAYRRSRTRYALTDRRALIARSRPERSIRTYPILEDAPLEIRPGPLATIIFAAEVRRAPKGHLRQIEQGFELIPEGDHVFRLLQQIRRARTSDPEAAR